MLGGPRDDGLDLVGVGRPGHRQGHPGPGVARPVVPVVLTRGRVGQHDLRRHQLQQGRDQRLRRGRHHHLSLAIGTRLPGMDAGSLPPGARLLHIGIPKTGTTAIQTAAAGARRVAARPRGALPRPRPQPPRAGLCADAPPVRLDQSRRGRGAADGALAGAAGRDLPTPGFPGADQPRVRRGEHHGPGAVVRVRAGPADPRRDHPAQLRNAAGVQLAAVRESRPPDLLRRLVASRPRRAAAPGGGAAVLPAQRPAGHREPLAGGAGSGSGDRRHPGQGRDRSSCWTPSPGCSTCRPSCSGPRRATTA